MSQQSATGAAETTSASDNDLTGRTANEPSPQSKVRADKLKDAARPAEAQNATDAIADAAERAAHPPMSR